MDALTAGPATADGRRTSPWYRLHPSNSILVALALFVAISVLQWFNNGTGQAIAVLYVLPISLLAVTLGARGGLTGATGGFVLFAVFEIGHGSGDIDATGWAVRAIAMFLLGGLLGRATDQTTASERAALAEQQRRCQLEEANHRYAEAFEINDSLLQQMVAAKWMVEQNHTDQATELLTETIARGERMVAGLLPSRVSRPADLPLSAWPGDHVLAQPLGRPHPTPAQ
jgi:K+-sensing histidine kinase KdpD